MMRLDKYLVHVGLGSRTQVKQFVKLGKITVNGVIVKKSDMSVDEVKDCIMYDNDKLVYTKFVYYMMNKPSGVVSATTDNRDKTVLDLMTITAKDVFPVGRLDKDTTGLLLLTNDGQLAHDLLSPKKHVDKVYIATVEQPLSAQTIQAFKDGITLADGFVCQSADLVIIDDTTAKVTIREGKFHQVKRMFLACQNRVTTLKRIQMGNLTLDESLALGEYRPLSSKELESLKK